LSKERDVIVEEWKSLQRIIRILLNYHGPKLRVPGVLEPTHMDLAMKLMLFTHKMQHDIHDFWFDSHLWTLGLLINVLESPGTHTTRMESKSNCFLTSFC
jgi:hypothetical protein